MKILSCESRFLTEYTLQRKWIGEITFSSNYEISIIDKFKKLDNSNELMLDTLRFFNKSVKAVNMTAETYDVEYKGKIIRLPIRRFSRGEKLITLCLMADKTKTKVSLCYELSQLDKRTILKLIDDYKYSEYIELVPPTESIEYILKSLMK